jgi:tripartite-type tricarboxylate transporter receptor subunit TctC
LTGALHILFGVVLATGIAAVDGHAQTATYPDRPVKMFVGFAAGGGTDVAARILAQKLTEALGQTVVVENRPGASGMIAAEAVAKSAADGYTLMMGSQTTLAVAPALYRKFSVDAAKDFVGVAMAGVSPLVLVVHPSVPVQSVRDLIALAKAKPGTINFGSGGLGTTPHMAGELFSIQAGVKMVHVAYRGEAPAINDLLGGQLHLIFANLSAVIGNVKARVTACARRHQRATRRHGAGNSHHRGSRPPRLRRGDLVRIGCTGRNRPRDRIAIERRGDAPCRSAGDPETLRGSRHDDRPRLPRRARCLYQVRDRQVVAGDQGGRCPGVGIALAGTIPISFWHQTR